MYNSLLFVPIALLHFLLVAMKGLLKLLINHIQFIRIFYCICACLFFSNTNASVEQQRSGLNPNKLLTQYIIDGWTTDNGLINNSILDLERTQDGYMWIATYGGLLRFDGTNFREFPELTDINGIRSLLEDRNGGLWIGSDDGKLINYKEGSFTFLEIDEDLINASITAIEEDREGTIWIGTRSGMAFVNGKKLQKLDHPLLSRAFVYCVEVDQANNVWIGTSGLGLFQYTKDTAKQFTSDHGLINNSIRSIHCDSQERLIIGSEGGLTFLSSEGSFKSYTTKDGLPHNYINEILEDSRGTLWLGTDGGLTRLIDDKFETLTQTTGLSDNTVQALHEDQVGLLWVGTYRGGLNRLKDGKFINYGMQEGLNDELVYVTRSDGARIWIGTDDGLSYVEQDGIRSIRLGNNPSINTIKDILVEPDGSLWIGTSGGLISYANGRIKKSFTTANGLSSNRVRRLSKDRSGRLWVATAKGLNMFDPSTNRFRSFGLNDGLDNEFILSLLVDRQNRIWVGTNGGGLFLFENDRFKGFGESKLGSNIIFGLSEDPNGNLWISANSGISRYDGEKFLPVTREHGLPSNTVFQTIIVGGYHWLFTDKGVVRIETEMIDRIFAGTSNSIADIRLLNKSEGMRSDQVTGVSISDIHSNGNILVSTLKGLSVLNPSELKIGDVPTEVKITSVVKDGLELENYDKIEFGPGTRYYEFHYTGLNFYSPEKIKFRYRLKNFDDDWVDVGNRQIAYYNDLPPGEYTFQVLASNSDGVWNEEPVELGFCQQAYFYETRWFYFVSFMVLAVGAFSWYRARVRLLKDRNRKLKELVAIRTADVKKQNEELTQLNHIKDRLFSIISHDIRGPLDSLYSLLDILNRGQLSEKEFLSLSSSLARKLSDVKDLLNELLNWSRSQLEGLTVNPEKINLRSIVEENFQLFESQAVHKQLSLKNGLPDSEYVNADLNMTKVIVRNLVSNAIKFSKSGGKIEVVSKNSGGLIEYSIMDNGVGISKENLNKLFDKEGYTTAGTKNEIGTGIGLMLVKEFVEKNNGTVCVESEEGGGSTFKFTLPSGDEL